MENFKITKRDGSQDRFSLDKIMNAVIKAFQSVDEQIDLNAISKIISRLDIHEGITVEDIQNQVEEALMAEGFFKVAKSFMLYRQRHTEYRLLQCVERRYRLEVRRQCQRGTQEHRDTHRRTSQVGFHTSEPPSAHRPHQEDVRQGSRRRIHRQAQAPLYI